MTKRIAIENLEAFCTQAFEKAGMRPEDAAVVADVLTTTDTWGTFSHGTGKVRNYLNTIRAGGIDAKAQPAIMDQGPSWAVVDNNSAMGMVGSYAAMEEAITKARESVISWVGLRNGSHFGAAGYYANMAAEQGMIGIAFSNADPNMTAPGARGHVIGNNPLAYAIPVGHGKDPILFDICMSSLAYGKILAVKQRGESGQSAWITDADGLPTTDLSQWPGEGSMIPMGAHKGFGIALLVESITSLLSGGGILDQAKSWVHNPTEYANLGQSFMVINIGKILPLGDFERRADEMVCKIESAPLAKGSEEPIHVPGKNSWRRRQDALENGIPLPESVMESLYGVAKDMEMSTELLDNPSSLHIPGSNLPIHRLRPLVTRELTARAISETPVALDLNMAERIADVLVSKGIVAEIDRRRAVVEIEMETGSAANSIAPPAATNGHAEQRPAHVPEGPGPLKLTAA